MGKAPLGMQLGCTSSQFWGDVFKVKVNLTTSKCTSKHLLFGDSLFFWELLSLSQLGRLLSFLWGEPPYKILVQNFSRWKKHDNNKKILKKKEEKNMVKKI